MSVLKKTIKVLFIALVLSLGAIAIAYYYFLPEGIFEVHSGKCHINFCGFARRWDGSCNGWTQELALRNIIGSLMHFYAYNVIGLMLLISHPVKQGSLLSKVSIIFSGLFVFGCGFTHFMDAYTTLNPCGYYLQVDWLVNNGVISIIAGAFVVYSLLRLNKLTIMQTQEKAVEGLSKKVPTIDWKMVQSFEKGGRKNAFEGVDYHLLINETTIIQMRVWIKPSYSFGWHDHPFPEHLRVENGELEMNGIVYKKDEEVIVLANKEHDPKCHGVIECRLLVTFNNTSDDT